VGHAWQNWIGVKWGAELEVARRLPKASLAAGRKKVLFSMATRAIVYFFCDLLGVNFFSGQRQRTFSVYIGYCHHVTGHG
jgi:hypothetical protein